MPTGYFFAGGGKEKNQTGKKVKIVAALTPKQQCFCDEYLLDLNGRQAAIRAGYSEKTADQQAARLLANVKVQKYLQKRKQERVERTEITQDMVLFELANIAFSNIADFVQVVEKEAMTEIDGKMVPVLDDEGNPVKYKAVDPVLTANLTEKQKRALSIIKKGRDGFDIKPYDKVRALELLGKHLGMFTDNVNVTGEVNNPFENLTTDELKKLVNSG